jgi:hypothetical protein
MDKQTPLDLADEVQSATEVDLLETDLLERVVAALRSQASGGTEHG